MHHIDQTGRSFPQLLAFPPQELPLPDAPLSAEYELTPAGGIVTVSRGKDSVGGPRPYHEAYLQLYALDLDDRDDIVRFLNANGPLSLPEDSRDLGHRGFDFHEGYKEVRELLEEAEHQLMLEIADWDRLAGYRKHYGYAGTLALFVWQAQCLRDLVRCWRWYREDIAVLLEEWESPVWTVEDEYFPMPTNPVEAAELLRQGIRTGLRPFHPELRIATFEEDPRLTTYYGGTVDFYSICCLELFNLIVRDTGLAQCANERCQRMFGLQEGRSQKGRHRSVGVKYCSLSCARAQAQRDYRRRHAKRDQA
jgi:hypothetical protein